MSPGAAKNAENESGGKEPPETDIAVLKTEASGLPVVTLGNIERISEAVGNHEICVFSPRPGGEMARIGAYKHRSPLICNSRSGPIRAK
jgi:hypothetical protein